LYFKKIINSYGEVGRYKKRFAHTVYGQLKQAITQLKTQTKKNQLFVTDQFIRSHFSEINQV